MSNTTTAYLVRVHPHSSRSVHPLSGEVSIGRSPPCEILIVNDLVSRRHAVVEETAAGWLIRDLNSSNGLFVNGIRVEEQLLAPGDLIRIGTSLLRFCCPLEPVDLETPREGELLVGRRLASLREQLRELATSPAPVLLVGPAGSGKSMAAAYLHQAAETAVSRPLVRVDCAAVTPKQLKALAAAAAGGTLFLRWAGALSARCQRALARELSGIQRLVLSTCEPLPPLLPALGARLTGLVTLRVPALEEHAEDIPELVDRFAQNCGLRRRVRAEELEQLCRRSWPENVRQLEQTVVQLDRRDEVSSSMLAVRSSADLQTELARALRLHRGDVDAAAETLGISRSQLYRRAERLGVRVAEFRWHDR